MSRFETTNTYSRDLETDEEKIRFVRRYFALFSEVQAAEFHIEYRVGETGDTCDMRGAFLVAPSDCEDWLVGEPVDVPADRVLSWFAGILPEGGRWHRSSRPVIHQRPTGHAVIVAYRSEGIILKRFREPDLDWLDWNPTAR